MRQALEDAVEERGELVADRVAVSSTSSWLSGPPPRPAAWLVMQEMPSTRAPITRRCTRRLRLKHDVQPRVSAGR
jgi:hypothetical protein